MTARIEAKIEKLLNFSKKGKVLIFVIINCIDQFGTLFYGGIICRLCIIEWNILTVHYTKLAKLGVSITP